MIDVMPGLECTDMAKDRITDQAQVADGIKYLVADKFIMKAQPFRIENLFVINDNGIFQRPAPCEPGGLEAFDIFEKAERACRGQFFAETCSCLLYTSDAADEVSPV